MVGTRGFEPLALARKWRIQAICFPENAKTRTDRGRVFHFTGELQAGTIQ